MSKNLLVTTTLSCFLLSMATPAIAAPESATAIVETGLREAVNVALEHTAGQVLEAERERKGGTPVYEVDIVHGNQITEVSVDIATKKVVSAKTDDLKHRIKKELIPDRILALLRGSKVTLPEAIAKAEGAMSAKAAEASFKLRKDQPVYDIDMEANDQHREVLVDANTGELQEVK